MAFVSADGPHDGTSGNRQVAAVTPENLVIICIPQAMQGAENNRFSCYGTPSDSLAAIALKPNIYGLFLMCACASQAATAGGRTMAEPQHFSIANAAELLGVSRCTIQRMRTKRKIAVHYIGDRPFVSLAEIERLSGMHDPVGSPAPRRGRRKPAYS
jgi:hypothetical protein